MIDKDEERTENNYSKANAFAPSNRIINGYGDTLNLSGPELAIYRFYKAFNEKDITTMAKVWANTEDITAENPAGGIRRGWSDLKWVYDKVLGSPAKVRAEFYDYTIHEAGDVFWSVGRERVFLNLSGEDTTLNVRITRIFRMIDGIWRLVHLHGSFEDSNMMLRYQQATGSGGS